MRIIERAKLDTKRWDALVAQTPEASFFSYSWYLDAVAENWCVLTDDEYACGIALPYTRRMGVEILYIPIFGRFQHFFGEIPNSALDIIKKRFKIREFATSTQLFDASEKRVFQTISNHEERSISSQAKRSLKKATKEGLTVSIGTNFSKVLSAIRTELDGKFEGVNAEKMKGLEKLFQAAQDNGMIKVVEVSNGVETGGVVCIGNEKQLLYVKGACSEEMKRNGGMYLALNEAILLAGRNNQHFDFGGSNVEGVKRFNHNLGGTDQHYYFHQADEGPLWFRMARKFKKSIKR